MTSLFHTYILTLKQQIYICELDLFSIDINFETTDLQQALFAFNTRETTQSSKYWYLGL